jgi:non-specific serine/threonine protein kinase
MGLPSELQTGDAALTADAVRLFLDRARSVRTDFAATSSNTADIVAICRRLDGMPLAIELAAARVGTLSPAEILPRLEDRFRLLTQGARTAPTRQRTLRATIDWSFELLDETESVLLRRLSVFAGDFGPDSAEDICSLPPLDGSRVLDALGGLVDKCMVQAGPGPDGTMRYRLLETVRAYAVERLEDGQEARAIRDRHLDFYTRLAVTAEQRRRTHGAMAEHRRLWAEIAEVRAALEWSHGDPAAELLLVASLRFVWWVYSPVEGLRRLGEVLARPRAAQAPGTRALAASTWSALSGRGGHVGDARWALQEVAELAAQAGDAFLVAHDPLGRGYLAERAERDPEKARHLIAVAIAALERLETSPELAMAYCSLGGIEIQLGNPGAAAPLVRRGLDLALALEDDFGAVGAYFTLGWLELERGALASARAAFMAGLDLAPEGDLVSIAHQVEGVACAAAPTDAVRALTLLGAAARMREEVAAPQFSHWRPWPERAIATARGALASRKADEAWDNGEAMGPARVIALLRQDKGRRAGRLEWVPGPLSRRELEIAHLVSMGLTSRAIAERLFLAERTVESHLDHIMTKLDFGSRAQVAAWVAEQQLGDRGAEPGV